MKKNKGFTLIELLIVISLLGALAVGLLATIDPFEQLKRGNDTSSRNTVSEFYNAAIRYYATAAEFPWTPGINGVLLGSPDARSWITTLISAGELKEKFVELATTTRLNKMYLTSTSTNHIAVCFMPESKQFQKDKNTIFTSTGTLESTNCKATGGTANCAWCIQ